MLIDIATASPPYKVAQSFAADELKKRMGGNAVICRLIDMAANQSGIDHRFIVIQDGDENSTEKFFTRGGNHFCLRTQQSLWDGKSVTMDLR